MSDVDISIKASAAENYLYNENDFHLPGPMAVRTFETNVLIKGRFLQPWSIID